MKVLSLTSRSAHKRGGYVLPVPPAAPWVSVLALDPAGTRLHVQLLNDAMAPTLPAGTWLRGWEVQAAGPLTPGLYLVRWPEHAGAYRSYVGRLLPEGIEPDRLSFDFDGSLPEPIITSITRTEVGPNTARLYRLIVLQAAGNAV